MKVTILFKDGVNLVQDYSNGVNSQGMDFLEYIQSAKKDNVRVDVTDNDGKTYVKTFDEVESITITFD